MAANDEQGLADDFEQQSASICECYNLLREKGEPISNSYEWFAHGWMAYHAIAKFQREERTATIQL